MNKLTKIIVVIFFTAVILGLIYQQIEIENLKSLQSSNSTQPTATSINPTSHPTLSPTSTPTSGLTPTTTPTSNPLPANVTADLQTTTIRPPIGYYLLINGTVTNNSPNTAYNVGLHANAVGSPFVQTVILIDMIVPITSAEYGQASDNTAFRVQASANGSQNIVSNEFPLSTLTPYQSVPVEIKMYPQYQSESAILRGINVTLVWSNTP
jgi:hypothetical protein